MPKLPPNLDGLKAVFETNTAAVMIAPNKITKDVVAKIVKEFALDYVMRDFGTIAARELANQIETRGLRPADYADLADLAETMSERLMQELGKDPEAFNNAFISQLRIRG